MQPYVEDYLRNPATGGEKKETQTLFSSWTDFKDEMGRIFGEVDAENQAEKAITRLKQTKLVSTYTAEFKQLQLRIDWDDAALRTVFENGLKETIKDNLVHHDKPGDLHSLIELATRIDNRLWERTEQKKNAFSAPNTKKHRRQIKVDREGDVIMTDKVQERFKDRKTRGGRPDGLSKEERQKRCDKKACLRCGEDRDGSTEHTYPRTVQLLDDDVSDTDLYDEARMLGNEAYELVPQAKEVPDVISRDETTPVDRSVTSTEVRQRLAEHRCWVCGSQEHMAEDCRQKGQIAITGHKAEETAYQAILEQPYFEDPEVQDDEPVTPSVSEWKTEEHQAAHWTECELRCRFHKGQRRTVGWRMNDEWHETLLDKECRVEACPMHKKPEPSTQWGNWDNLHH
ncbi:hypothetical protein P3342_004590 [Pyrenophora teres f. teres]|nr:hypothetical protein P3342_004590 [Pyrenophora teres f. teres]